MSHYLAVNQIDQAGLYSTRCMLLKIKIVKKNDSFLFSTLVDDTFDTYEAVDAPFQ